MEGSRSERERYLDFEIGNALEELEGCGGPDFVAVKMPLCEDGRVDILRYKHENYDVLMTGVAEDPVSKRKETAQWVDALLDADFPNPRRSLKSTDFTNRDVGEPDSYSPGYRFSKNLSQRGQEEIKAGFREVFCPSPFEQNYEEI